MLSVALPVVFAAGAGTLAGALCVGAGMLAGTLCVSVVACDTRAEDVRATDGVPRTAAGASTPADVPVLSAALSVALTVVFAAGAGTLAGALCVEECTPAGTLCVSVVACDTCAEDVRATDGASCTAAGASTPADVPVLSVVLPVVFAARTGTLAGALCVGAGMLAGALCVSVVACDTCAEDVRATDGASCTAAGASTPADVPVLSMALTVVFAARTGTLAGVPVLSVALPDMRTEGMPTRTPPAHTNERQCAATSVSSPITASKWRENVQNCTGVNTAPSAEAYFNPLYPIGLWLAVIQIAPCTV